MDNREGWQRVAWLPEDYNRVWAGAHFGEWLEGVELVRYDEIVDQMLQEQGFERRGHEIVAAPGKKGVRLNMARMLKEAQAKAIAERDQRFRVAKGKLGEYILAHDELKSCMPDWDDMSWDESSNVFSLTLSADYSEDAEIEWLLGYDAENDTIICDKM